MVKLKALSGITTEDEIRGLLVEANSDMGSEVEFEDFLRVSQNSYMHLHLQF